MHIFYNILFFVNIYIIILYDRHMPRQRIYKKDVESVESKTHGSHYLCKNQ